MQLLSVLRPELESISPSDYRINRKTKDELITNDPILNRHRITKVNCVNHTTRGEETIKMDLSAKLSDKAYFCFRKLEGILLVK